MTLELFVERGIEHVTMAEVATRAGVAPGLLYHYFGNKDGLLAAVFAAADPRDAFAGLAESLAGQPLSAGLREFCVRAAAVFEERGDVVRILFREMLAPEPSLPIGIADIQEEVLGNLARYFTDRIEAGELRPHDPRVPLRLLISGILVLGVTRQPVEPWVDGFVDIIINGIGAQE
ncbi:TetR/AcrR family transcriptional regulator [Kribbella albertanoniae]|uniref:TetR/AcrR family transcriptional regulator n=1 Tax=Kribbella albertanoniae TaxID=1266829 RepID=UPI00192DD538|nr:TetR/AcrR family transcriptional regulator [Kribbella albertanoniae]